jgi:hypothetical protein
MIFSHTLDSLSEDEISILYFIVASTMPWLDTKRDFLKYLRKDIVFRIIEVLKKQALDEYKSIFDTLREKLAAE